MMNPLHIAPTPANVRVRLVLLALALVVLAVFAGLEVAASWSPAGWYCDPAGGCIPAGSQVLAG